MQTSIHTRTSQASIHFMMTHHCKGGRVGAGDGQGGTQSWGCYRQRQETEISVWDLTVHWERRKTDYLSCWRGKRAPPTKSFHAWWFAEDGSEPGSGAGARGGGVVAWSGGVGL